MPFRSALGLIASSYLLITAATSSGCVSSTNARLASGIDAQFKLNRTIAAANRDAVSESPGVRAYQTILSQTLSSRCHYFPSDSAYHIVLAKKCGAIESTVRSMSRSMLEYDAASMNLPILLRREHVDFEDIPNECGWI